MKESLTTEHYCKHVRNALPSLLNGGRVSNKDTGHIQALGWNVTNGSLKVVGDPFDKIRGVLIDSLEHLVIDFLTGHAATEHHGAGEVTSVTGIGGTHHVLGIKRLLGKLGYGQNTVVLRRTGSERRESNEEEMKTREGDHVDGEFSEIAVELTRETERAGSSSDGIGNKVVQVTVTGVGKLESAEANVVKCLVVKSKALIGIFHQLVDGQSRIVGLNNSVRNFGGRNNTVSAHDTIRVLFTNLGNQESSHTRACSTSHGMCDLETLKHITSLSLLTHHLHDSIHKLGALRVVTLGPVVTSAALTEHKVVRAEKGSKSSRTNCIHCSRLEIGQHSAWDVTTSLTLIKVHIDTLELEFIGPIVGSLSSDPMLGRHHLPELCSDLVTALSGLKVNDLSHVWM
mmetsp:Transcript_20232/g.46851  ORF Transcript_20232/g.46851 Transcript_20232/m.46851 type:complete len:400 (-) Transcript_20232:106-1305(-)